MCMYLRVLGAEHVSLFVCLHQEWSVCVCVHVSARIKSLSCIEQDMRANMYNNVTICMPKALRHIVQCLSRRSTSIHRFKYINIGYISSKEMSSKTLIFLDTRKYTLMSKKYTCQTSFCTGCSSAFASFSALGIHA